MKKNNCFFSKVHYLWNLKRITQMLFLCAVMCGSVNAKTNNNLIINEQEKSISISGIVTDVNNLPIPGVAIIIKGTSIGMATNNKGEFHFTLPNKENIILEFRFVGMKTQEIRYSGQEKINVVMEEDVSRMDEVIITGYQNRTKREMTSAVVQVKAEDILLDSKFSIDQMLNGQIAGMSVLQTSGEPGATPKIRIRGTSSIYGAKSPIWVLDGVILDDPVEVDNTVLNGDDAAYLIGNAIAGVNPRDIESITVLKDASATSIYGVRAANGVVVVTTKRGKEGPMEINYNSGFSLNQRPSYGDFYLMNAKERIELSQDIIANNIKYGRTPYKLGYEGLYLSYLSKELNYEQFNNEVQKMAKRNTNWYKILFRNPVSQNHNISLSGGNQGTRYYASIGLDYNPGTANKSISKRYNALLKLDSWINENIYIGLQLNTSVNRSDGFHESLNPNQYAYETARTIPCFDENGDLFFYTTRQRALHASSSDDRIRDELIYNVLDEMRLTGKEGKVNSTLGKLDFKINFLKNFTYEFMGSYNVSQSKTTSFAEDKSNYVGKMRFYSYGFAEENSADENASPLAYGGIISKNETEQKKYTIRNQLLYNKSFQTIHSVSLMASSEISSSKYEGFSGTFYGWSKERGHTITPLLTDGYLKVLPSLRPKITNNTLNIVSWYGSGSYSFSNKVFFYGNIRADGSNSFGSNPKYRFLPIWSLSGKYIVSEDIFPKSKAVNEISFRASYGIQGNVDPNTSPDLVIKMGSINTHSRLLESYIEYLPNPDLRWEKTTSYNFGMDFSFWNNRINGTVDTYRKDGKDMIINKNVSHVLGLNSVKINAGKVRNTGVEGSLTVTPVKQKDYEFGFTIICSYNKNKLVSANYEEDITVWDQINGEALVEGKPLGTFYSIPFAGLDPENGYPRFYDINGEDDYSLYDYELKIVKSGKELPDLDGSFKLNFKYKTLRINFDFLYKIGGHKRLPNIYRTEYSKIFDPVTNVTKELTKRWKKLGDENHTIFPALYDDDVFFEISEKNQLINGPTLYPGTRLYDISDVRVAKTDNLRLRNISLNYILPQKYTKTLGVQYIGIGMQAENLFQIAKKEWRGRDPESGDSNTPLPRVYSFNLNVTF